jgi:hypothetical protein
MANALRGRPSLGQAVNEISGERFLLAPHSFPYSLFVGSRGGRTWWGYHPVSGARKPPGRAKHCFADNAAALAADEGRTHVVTSKAPILESHLSFQIAIHGDGSETWHNRVGRAGRRVPLSWPRSIAWKDSTQPPSSLATVGRHREERCRRCLPAASSASSASALCFCDPASREIHPFVPMARSKR